MTNEQLNKLSIEELRDLNSRVVQIIKLKLSILSTVNADKIKVGMTVKYIGGTNKIKNEKFEVVKIKKTNALCVSNLTGISWNIRMANIEPI